MICRKCLYDLTYVVNSRDSRDGRERRRRRQCLKCGHRWSTLEIPRDLIQRKPKGSKSLHTS